LEDDDFTDDYIQTNRQRLAANYQFVTDFLREHGIPYSAGGNAGIFAWADLRPESRHKCSDRQVSMSFSSFALLDNIDPRPVNNHASTGQTLEAKFLAKKVYLAEGESFGGQPGLFRIVFS
jgi:hypothetical protein